MPKNIKKNHWTTKFTNEPKMPVLAHEFGHKKVDSEEEIVKLYKSTKSSVTETEFIKLVNYIHQLGGKVKKNGNVYITVSRMEKIINEFKALL